MVNARDIKHFLMVLIFFKSKSPEKWAKSHKVKRHVFEGRKLVPSEE